MTTGARWFAVVAAVSLVAVPGYVGWLVGQGQYLDDYCLTKAPLPEDAIEFQVVSGPSYDSPVHLRCDWETHPDVIVLDLVPLLGALAVVVGALAVGALTWWWLRAGRLGE